MEELIKNKSNSYITRIPIVDANTKDNQWSHYYYNNTRITWNSNPSFVSNLGNDWTCLTLVLKEGETINDILTLFSRFSNSSPLKVDVGPIVGYNTFNIKETLSRNTHLFFYNIFKYRYKTSKTME